jgi:hypothetical protein
MTKVVKNTNISEMLEVSRGNFDVLKRMTNEFRELASTPAKKTPATSVQRPATAGKP